MNYYKNQLIHVLYSRMFSQRLRELSRNENPPYIEAEMYFKNLTPNYKAHITTALVADNEAKAGIEALLIETERIKQYGFTQDELNGAAKALLKRLELKFKEKDKTKSSDYVNQYIKYFSNGIIPAGIEFEYRYAKENLYKISLSEVNDLVKEQITDKNRVIAVAAPEKEDVILPSPDEIKEILKQTKIAKIKPHKKKDVKDKVKYNNLVKTYPKPAEILTEKTENGVTEWTFANGTRVIIKPTVFKSNEILMSSFSLGGYSSVSDEDLPTAKMLNEIVRTYGAGIFSYIEVKQKLSGSDIDVWTELGKNEQGIYGRCAADDFEKMMQLTYMKRVAMRPDKKEFNKFIQRKSTILQNRKTNPNSKFNDSIYCITNNYHSRRSPETLEFLNRVEYEKLNKIYEELISNTNGLTFIFVGNITPAKAKHFVQVYIGGLPRSEKKISWKDENVRPSKGVVSRKIAMKMEVPKSTVFIGYAGEFQFLQSSPTIIDALQYILNLRFIEKIREQEGGTYGVTIQNEKDIFPVPKYSFNIRFDCDPDRADDLINIVYQQIKNLQSEGPTEAELQKTIEYLKKKREEDLKQNRFWNNVLVRKVYYGFDYYSVDNFEEVLQSITNERLKTEAQKFFDEKNRVELVLIPQK